MHWHTLVYKYNIYCNIFLFSLPTDILSDAVSIGCSRGIYRRRCVLSSGRVRSVILCITRRRARSYVHCRSYASSVSGRSIKLKLTRPVRASEFPLSEHVRALRSRPYIVLKLPLRISALSIIRLWKHINEIKRNFFINFIFNNIN